MRRLSWLVIAGLLVALGVAPLISAVTNAEDSYRDAANPPVAPITPLPTVPALPPNPPVPGLPPAAPTQPCAVNGFVIDCTAGGTWATSSMPGWGNGVAASTVAWEGLVGAWPSGTLVPWGSAYGGTLVTWEGQAQTWATVDFKNWAIAAPTELTSDEIGFSGPGGTTSATVHVHDAVGDLNVVFVVKAGGNQLYLCKHSCTVPVATFAVSVDPLDVPPNVWIGAAGAPFALPNLPAVSGDIFVTFLP